MVSFPGSLVLCEGGEIHAPWLGILKVVLTDVDAAWPPVSTMHACVPHQWHATADLLSKLVCYL